MCGHVQIPDTDRFKDKVATLYMYYNMLLPNQSLSITLCLTVTNAISSHIHVAILSKVLTLKALKYYM